MLDKALSAVEKYNMLSPGAAVIAAVSGGADSMAMLLFLMKISERYSLSLTVAHVNHGLRGEEARRDEEYVRSFCEKNSLRFEVLHADVAALAKQSGETCEECGRRVRYEFFESIDKNAKIATAHTASDNAETMLFNLARGTGGAGLRGIPPVRGEIVRPLLGVTRREIEAYLAENGGSVDYIHGDDEAIALAAGDGCWGILMPRMDKAELFTSVLRSGPFPKKSFSIGLGADKRYYLECRKL